MSLLETIERLRAYYGRPEHALVGDSVDFTRDALRDAIGARWGGQHRWVYVHDFGEGWVAWGVEDESGVTTDFRATWTLEDGVVVIGEAEEVERRTVWEPTTQKAFLSLVDGKPILTAPVGLDLTKAATPNPHYLWLQGRLVGGEKANRNGAFWATADLEVGLPTVNHGPLNWLHEGRHVIGSIVASELIRPAVEVAGEPAEPHIRAASAVWRWLWPDEARVIEMAADQGSLWYSMECVAREVSCMGDTGCGQTFDYAAVMTGNAGCQHIAERSSTRRLVDPTFLGAAVIVPPVKPGWADADLTLMQTAASLAETAHAQVGDNGMDVQQWEALMAAVVVNTRA